MSVRRDHYALSEGRTYRSSLKEVSISRIPADQTGRDQETALVNSLENRIQILATRYARIFQCPVEDLLQAGRLEAVKCARVWLPDGGCSYLTFCWKRVAGAIIEEARMHRNPVRIPRAHRRTCIVSRVEIDAPASGDRSTGTVGDSLQALHLKEEPEIQTHDFEALAAAMGQLDSSGAAVLVSRFLKGMSWLEVAGHHQMTVEAARAVQKKALKKLRSILVERAALEQLL